MSTCPLELSRNRPSQRHSPPPPATPTPEATEAARSAAGRRRRIIWIVALAALVIVGLIIWRVFFATPALPASIVAVSGRIEGDDSAVAPKTTGRILEVRVREGDIVNAGDVIAILDDAQIRAREDQARAALAAAEAKDAAAREQIAVLQQQLMQNHLQVGPIQTRRAGTRERRPRPNWPRPNPTWRSSRRRIRLPHSTRTRIHGWRSPERSRSGRASRRRRRPISRRPRWRPRSAASERPRLP